MNDVEAKEVSTLSRFPLAGGESKGREAFLTSWSLDPCLWIGIPRGTPIPAWNPRSGIRYCYVENRRFKPWRKLPWTDPDIVVSQVSEIEALPLKSLATVIRAFRSVGLGFLSCRPAIPVKEDLAKALLRWRREVVNRCIYFGEHQRIMQGFKAMYDWIHWRKMSNPTNPPPESLPSWWWGQDKGVPNQFPIPKYMVKTSILRDFSSLWEVGDHPSRELDLVLCRILAGKRGLPPGDDVVCKQSIAKHREQLHSRAPGPWEGYLETIAHASRRLASAHAHGWRSTETHVSVSTAACFEYSTSDGGKNTELLAAYKRATLRRIDVSQLRGQWFYDACGTKVSIPTYGPLPDTLVDLYLQGIDGPRTGTLEDTILSEAGGPLLIAICLQEMVYQCYIDLAGSIDKDIPLWRPGSAVAPRNRLRYTGKPLPSRVVSLPEEGWKARTLAIPPWAYSMVSAASRHWFQDNLLANDARVGVGFESGYKLWDSVKNLGEFPATWLQYPTVSGDVSQCTDSSSLVVHRVIWDNYLRVLEERGVPVPSIVWLSTTLLCSPHVFLYRESVGDEWVSDEREHVTGVMMGEGMSFPSMTLQNLMLDDEVVQREREVYENQVGVTRVGRVHVHDRKVMDNEPPSYRLKTALADIVGDDYKRSFCTLPDVYMELAATWFSWKMSRGKNGISTSCVQLAEEWAYMPKYHPSMVRLRGKFVSKQDVVKIKYYAVPGPDDSTDCPPWVGRAGALAQALDWCLDLHLSVRRLLVDEFRRSYQGIPKRIPLSWCLPQILGGLSFPTTRSVWRILKKMRVDRKIAALMSLPAWELQATLTRLSGFHAHTNSRRGVAFPKLPLVDAMLGGFRPTPTQEENGQPVLSTDMVRYFKANPSRFAPSTGWKWNPAIQDIGPTIPQITQVLREEYDYIPVPHVASRLARAEMLHALVTGDTIERASVMPRFGKSAARILERVLNGVTHKYPLEYEGFIWCLDKWHEKMRGVESPVQLNRVLTYMMGMVYVQRSSVFAHYAPENYPWSFRFRKTGGMVRLPLRGGEENPYLDLQ